MNILESIELCKHYRVGDRVLRVLQEVSLTVASGEFLAIEGSSGSGKTTLLSLLSGLDKPTSGRVVLNQREITSLNEDQLAPLRNTAFGFVFQAFHLVPSLNALENVMFPAELRDDPQAGEKAAALLSRMGLWQRRDNFPQQLSGGEKQRVAICRALINDPAIIFADEPTGNLDSANGQAVIELLGDIRSERGTTLLLVTHNRQIARAADRVILLADGRIKGERRHAA
jgi:putative ABC transport system ATP-binding protein